MNPFKPITVIIADDHEIVRLGFKKLILDQDDSGFKCVGEASNGADLLTLVGKYHPDVVITDVKMPLMDGIEAAKIISEKYPMTRILSFSLFNDTSIIMGMIQAGARGYVVKTSSRNEIIEAIETVARGEFYYCSSISSKIFGALINSKEKKQKYKPISFSKQESNVIRLICKQQTTKEIAISLNLAERTIETYRQNIQEKIGAKNVVGIALYGLLNDIVPVGELLV